MKTPSRTTEVISVSLPKKTAEKLEHARREEGSSRSAFISHLIEKAAEEIRWQALYKKGLQTAQAFGITSEDDIDEILHSA